MPPTYRTAVPTFVLLTALLGVTACGSGNSNEATPSGSAATPGPTAAASASATPQPASTPPAVDPVALQLPRGGTSVFPEHVVVGFYGSAGGPSLGVLGEGSPAQAAARLEKAAAPFGPASGKKVLPAFELIATVAQASAGKSGLYSGPLSDAQVQTYLDAARKAKVLLILDLQPGLGDFLTQAKRFEKFLKEPDVGLGLDPEWQLKPGQKPGKQIGTTNAAKINQVSAYLQGLVQAGGLPEKVFIVHQFRVTMVKNRADVVKRPGLATVVHVDGFGSQKLKKEVYGVLSAKKGEFVNGFKLFYDEDTNLLTPKEAMAIRPRPELITYQ